MSVGTACGRRRTFLIVRAMSSNGEVPRCEHAWMKLTLLAVLLLVPLELGCRHRVSRITASGPAPPGPPISLEAGTTLALRTAQVIDWSSSMPGQTFAAVVSRDTNDAKGQIVLPSGSPAVLVVLRGQPAMANSEQFESSKLGLASVTLNGDSFLLRNEPQAGDSASLGASLGMFLGAVSGPEPTMGHGMDAPPQRGATREGIRWPVGSLLTFRLDRPVLLIGSHQ